jgi:hypothetical protein
MKAYDHREFHSRALQQLMGELAREDGQRFSVNHVLYERSVSYQDTLDQTLATVGCWVARIGPMQYQVRSWSTSDESQGATPKR